MSIFGTVIKFENDIKLGNGIYSIPDLALILQLPKHRVRRWMNEFWNTRLGQKYTGMYSWGNGRDKATNFLTLIEFYVFYQLKENKVSTRIIFQSHEFMAKELQTPYPFASFEVLTEGKTIFYSLNDGTTVYANETRQIVIKEAIESFCKKIEFSHERLAKRYWPLGKQHSIVVDPHHQFGQPTVTGTNISAVSIYSMYESGEPVHVISKLYDLTEEEVNDAITFCKRKVA